jgi:hypothetical protein
LLEFCGELGGQKSGERRGKYRCKHFGIDAGGKFGLG